MLSKSTTWRWSKMFYIMVRDFPPLVLGTGISPNIGYANPSRASSYVSHCNGHLRSFLHVAPMDPCNSAVVKRSHGIHLWRQSGTAISPWDRDRSLGKNNHFGTINNQLWNTRCTYDCIYDMSYVSLSLSLSVSVSVSFSLYLFLSLSLYVYYIVV